MATARTAPAGTTESDLEFRATLERLATLIVFCVLLLAVSMHIIAPALALRWASQPFIGAFVEPTLILNGTGPKEWALIADDTADPNGASYPDRLISIGGIPVRSTADIDRALSRFSIGDTVPIVFGDSSGPPWGPYAPEIERTVEVQLIAFPANSLFGIFVVPYFVGLAYLLIGLWVFRLRRHEFTGRMFALFCASMAGMVGGIFDLYTTHAFSALWSVAVPAAGAGIFTLSFIFPQEVDLVMRRPMLRWLAFAPALLIGAVGALAVNNFANPRVYAAVWLVGFLYSAVSAVWFFAITAYRWLRGKSPIVRAQSGYILLGSLGFFPAVIWVIASTAAPELRFNPVYFAPMALFPAGVAYAILRYRLLNTDYIIRLTLIYGILTVFTAVGYWLFVYGASVLAGAAVTTNSPFAIGLLVLVLVMVFNPIRNWAQSKIDFYFFRGSQAYREQLLAFGHALTESSELPFIAGELRQQIETTLKPNHLHIYLRDTSGAEYSAYAAVGRPDTDIRFPAEGALARALAAQRSTLYLAPDSPLPAALARDRARIAVVGSSLFVPLNSRTRLIGWLALGSRLSGEPYSQRDIDYLDSLADQSALAVERALAVESLEKRVNELNALSQVSQAVNFSISFDDLLELVYAQAGRVLDVRNFTIILHDPATQSFRYAFFIENDERDPTRENQPWPFGQGLASEVIRSGQPILTDDYLGECSRRRVSPLSRPYRAWMGVPLSAGSGAMGAMTIASLEAGHTFAEDQLKIFAAIADQAATAIDKARLYRQTEERARQLATLNVVAQVITSTLDLEPLLQRVLESAVGILDCEAGSLFLLDEETNDSILKVAVGPVARDIIGLRVPAGRGVVGSAAEKGEPVIVNNTANDPRWFQKPDQKTGFVSRAMMAVPLRIKERTIGVVEVINKRSGAPFTDDDTTLLTAFAGQAAVSIENARLFNLTDQALAARVEELSAMQRIDRELNAALDVKRVMTVILERALAASKANAGLAGLVTPEGIRIIAHRGYGGAIAQFLDAPFPTDAGLAGKAIKSRSTVFARNVKNYPEYIEFLPDTATQLTVPIVRENESIGVLLIESRHVDCFTDDQVTFLARLADHSVAAITNAQLYDEVNAANQAKSEFVSMVSHELKNPMQSIKGYTQLMLGGAAGAVSEGQQQFLNIVQGNVERMITIVSDLTDIARIESGRLQLNLKPAQFQAVIDEVVRSLQSACDTKQQLLAVEVEGELPLVLGDPIRLTQVLTNLVSNAHKYSPNGSQVTIRVQRGKNVWDTKAAIDVLHVSVQDTGFGIAPDDQAKLFTKFFRADNNRNDAPGTGLGLNIVRQMVELGGGKVWFESELGVGSTFHFTVPLAGIA